MSFKVTKADIIFVADIAVLIAIVTLVLFLFVLLLLLIVAGAMLCYSYHYHGTLGMKRPERLSAVFGLEC